MKKLVGFVLVCVLCIHLVLPSYVLAEEKPLKESDLYARCAVLMDAASGRVLFGKKPESPMPMASTTKIMTCILTLEQTSVEDIVDVSAYAEKMPDVQLNMKAGEHYRLLDLLYSLMLESHNDSAVAIAEHVAGNVEAFAAMMNKKAEKIGCKDTYFITPNGLDASQTVKTPDGGTKTRVHSTTAADLARILSYCIMRSPAKEQFLKITRTASYRFHNQELAPDKTVSAGARTFTCNNHNAFLHMMDGALTGKTGFTGNAGYCYVGALQNGGRTYVIALLACGWPGNKSWKWADAKKLFSYGVEHYTMQDITQTPCMLPRVAVKNAAGSMHSLAGTVLLPLKLHSQPTQMLLSKEDSVSVRVSLPKTLDAPVKKGARIGMVSYDVNGTCAARFAVTAEAAVDRRDFLWHFGHVFFRYFQPYPA